MGRFTANEIDNYGNSSTSSYFSLSNDGDVATVRFMYNDMNDIVGYAVHEVEIDGKKRYVNCIRSYNEPKHNCPLCAHGSMQRAKLYVPLYDCDSGEVKIWERGKTFFQKLSAICARYSNADTPLVAHTFEIERHGKKGETTTQYDIFETGKDDTRLEDLPDIPDVLGSVILDKTYDELTKFVETGSFDDASNVGYQRQYDEPTGRRTPANSGNRRREVF